ncbi:hypothetical protein K461DRAFT_289790 [Myriangium duriaei CBS 260.36]|uniref:N-acetylglucosamine-induced protein 1 n=1 Tax=Myriangium duriaei CBS 260.36 TaxID=1168546 RepID=A0A9P4J8V6_9PEZI|nr:hypothetical protein K461DRAFT_289790 [Myriangium duriaei CBS 260.36]
MAPIEYWQVNVPPSQQTATCPDFLVGANDKAKRILSTPDSEYHRLSWPEVRTVVAENKLDAFQRVPSDLRRYMAYVHKIKHDWGSVMDFVLKQRIRWEGQLEPRGRPFEDDSDIKILYNDWPYGIDEDIVHLVVWTKFDLAEDPSTGDLTDEARGQIDDYVGRIFRSRMKAEDVAWFKNWKSLKSVEAVEHFHVLLNRPDRAFVAELTGGDEPMAEKVKKAEAEGSA